MARTGIHRHRSPQGGRRPHPHEPGTGKIEVNGKAFEEYFPTANLQGRSSRRSRSRRAATPLTWSSMPMAAAPTARPARSVSRSPARSSSMSHSARRTEGTGFPHTRSADERAEKARPARRPQAVPVLQALIQETLPKRAKPIRVPADRAAYLAKYLSKEQPSRRAFRRRCV